MLSVSFVAGKALGVLRASSLPLFTEGTSEEPWHTAATRPGGSSEGTRFCVTHKLPCGTFWGHTLPSLYTRLAAKVARSMGTAITLRLGGGGEMLDHIIFFFFRSVRRLFGLMVWKMFKKSHLVEVHSPGG